MGAPGRVGPVEVHVGLLDRPVPGFLDPRELLARAEADPGGPGWRLDRTDAATHLVDHAQHGATAHRLHVDVRALHETALVIRGVPSVDWALVRDRFHRAGIVERLDGHLALAAELFGVEAPVPLGRAGRAIARYELFVDDHPRLGVLDRPGRRLRKLRRDRMERYYDEALSGADLWRARTRYLMVRSSPTAGPSGRPSRPTVSHPRRRFGDVASPDRSPRASAWARRRNRCLDPTPALNLAVVCGHLSRVPEEVPLASGDVLVRYEVTIPQVDERADTVPVVALSPPAHARGLDAGTEVVVVGRTRRRFWSAGGATRSAGRGPGHDGGRRPPPGRGHSGAGAGRWLLWRRSHTKRSDHVTDLASLLGDEADALLTYESKGIPRDDLHLPGPDFIDRVLEQSDRSPQVLRNLQSLFDHGRLGGTGYVSILPVDQGIEHSAAASFAPNPKYFDPGNIVRAGHRGRLQRGGHHLRRARASVSRRYAHRIPFIVKLNHNELLTYPNEFDQIMFGSVEEAYDLGRRRRRRHDLLRLRRVAPARSRRSPRPSRRPTSSACSPCCGATCATTRSRSTASTTTLSADLTGQANHLGVTIEADIIKQKLPENNGGYNAISGYGKTHKLVYEELTTDHPIDLTRWQVANCYMGRIGLINSGGESKGADDLAEAVRTAVINKRAGGTRPDLGPQGVPAPDRRGHRAAQRHPGRLPRRRGHHRLTGRGRHGRGRAPP